MARETKCLFDGTIRLTEYQLDTDGIPFTRYVLDLHSPGQKRGVTQVLEITPRDVPNEYRCKLLINTFAELCDRAIENHMFSGFVPTGKVNNDPSKM